MIKEYMVCKDTNGIFGVITKGKNHDFHIVYKNGGQVFNTKDAEKYVKELYEYQGTTFLSEDKEYWSKFHAMQFLVNPERNICDYKRVDFLAKKKVSFMEAFTAWQENGKTVEWESPYGEIIKFPYEDSSLLWEFKVNGNQIGTGAWYILD
jgi:hypothetical protein